MKKQLQEIDDKKYPDETGFVPLRVAVQRGIQMENNNPEFFWDVFMPTLRQYIDCGVIPFTPPICGAMVSTGTLDKETARDIWEYWNN